MGLGVPLACGSQCQPPAAYLPLAAGVPDQPLNLRFTLHSFTAFMAQLSECLVVHHGVPSSLFLAGMRVGLCKWARLQCSRNEPSFLDRITDTDVQTPRQRRTELRLTCPCRLARQTSAGPAGYAVKERGQPAHRIAVFSKADLLSRLSRARLPSDEGKSVPNCSGAVKYQRQCVLKISSRPRRSRARARGARGRRCLEYPRLRRRAGSGRRDAGACPSRE